MFLLQRRGRGPCPQDYFLCFPADSTDSQANGAQIARPNIARENANLLTGPPTSLCASQLEIYQTGI